MAAFDLPTVGVGLPTEGGVPYLGVYDNNNKIVQAAGQYWKNASGLWVPVSATDPLPTQLTGRKLALSYQIITEPLNVPSGGATTIIITPSSGELWRIKALGINLPAPSGASSGTQSFQVRPYSDNWEIAALEVTYNYNQSFQIRFNEVISTVSTMKPATASDWRYVITHLVATNNCPLRLIYYNNTDVAQTNSLFYEVVREVEYIVP